jgi:hypothetical protein
MINIIDTITKISFAALLERIVAALCTVKCPFQESLLVLKRDFAVRITTKPKFVCFIHLLYVFSGNFIAFASA